jgi:hypothetical protein
LIIVKARSTLTVRDIAELAPQEFAAATVISPFWPATPAFTVIEFVFIPAVIVQPVGKVQL